MNNNDKEHKHNKNQNNGEDIKHLPKSESEIYDTFSLLAGQFEQKLFRLQLELDDIKKIRTKSPVQLYTCLEQYVETMDEIDVIMEKIYGILDMAEMYIGDDGEEPIIENEEFSSTENLLKNIKEVCSDDYEDDVLNDKLPGLHNTLKKFLKDVSKYISVRDESTKIFNDSLLNLDELIKKQKDI